MLDRFRSSIQGNGNKSFVLRIMHHVRPGDKKCICVFFYFLDLKRAKQLCTGLKNPIIDSQIVNELIIINSINGEKRSQNNKNVSTEIFEKRFVVHFDVFSYDNIFVGTIPHWNIPKTRI